MTDETEARRKEREANEIPRGPDWLWNPWWWLGIIFAAIGLYLSGKANGR